MSVLGNRVIRKEDPHILTGEAAYTDSVKLAGSRYATFVRSTIPHGVLTKVDVSAARALPGVVGVYTGDDVALGPFPPNPFFPQIDPRFTRWPLARDRVRFVGEPIVCIVAQNRYVAADAADLVVVEYEPLPAITTLDQSIAGDVLLFPDLATNMCAEVNLPRPDDLFDGAHAVVSQTMVNRRMAPAPMEGRAIAATWDGSRFTLHAASQGVDAARQTICSILGFERDQVRVIAGDVGGGFGAKGGVSMEELVVSWVARELGGTVRWAETRSENMLAMGHGRGQRQTVEIGATRDGRIVGMHMHIEQEAGAYPDVGAGLPMMTMLMSSGVYAIPKLYYTSASYVTNTTPVGAFRGAGRPEASYAIERALDVLAGKLDLDPAELRRRNFIGRDAFPVTTVVGTVYDSGDYATALDKVITASGYHEARAEQARRRARGEREQLGIGMSCYVEITGAMPGPEPARVEVHADGTATVWAGSTPHGQGHITTFAMVAADRLGIAYDDITVLVGDTDRDPPGQVTGGSRTAQVCGTVVGRASDMVVDKARAVAANLLEAAVDDVVLDTERGRFHVRGTPARATTWIEVAAAADDPLSAEDSFEPASPTFPFGANVAIVVVDTETGRVRLDRFVGCDDAGTLLNPLLAEGQLHGGFGAGAGQALFEEIVYDAEGNPLTASFADYAFASAAEFPSFELIHMETPTPINELGAKGIGESGTVGATPAVINAVVDALVPYGITHIDMPATSERVWRAIAANQT